MEQNFSRYTVKHLDTTGFDDLPHNVQHILYHLTMAGNACRDIVYQQFGKFGIAIRDTLESLYLHGELHASDRARVLHDLKIVWTCNGIYHETQGDRMLPSFGMEEFKQWCQNDNLLVSESTKQLALKGLFSELVPLSLSSYSPYSGFDWAGPGVTTKERSDHIQNALNGFKARAENRILKSIKT